MRYSSDMVIGRWLGCVVAAAAAACAAPAEREYELTGQVLAVDEARQEVTIRHEDIPQFMPGMTMAFRVREPALLAGRAPGDLVAGTLVVTNDGAHLKRLEPTGVAPVAETPAVSPRILQPGDTPSDAALRDQTGAVRHLSDWRGHVSAVTFTYTRCPLPDFCPLMDRQFQRVHARILEDAGLRDAARLLSITVDPEHDTPAVLSAHAAALGADPQIWTFLTGSADSVKEVAAQFGVSIMSGTAPGGGIVHNLRTAVIDARGQVTTVLSGNDWDPDALLDALAAARSAR